MTNPKTHLSLVSILVLAFFLGKAAVAATFPQSRIVDVVGSCATGARLRIYNEGKFYEYEDPNPCVNGINSPFDIKWEDSILFINANGILPTEEPYVMPEEPIGDRNDRLYTIRDSFLNLTYKLYITKPCRNGLTASRTGAMSAKVVEYFLNRDFKIVPKSGGATDRECDYRAKRSNLSSVLKSIPVDSVNWRKLCLAKGVYHRIEIDGYQNLIIQGEGMGKTIFRGDLAMRIPRGSDAIVNLINVKNFVVKDLEIENIHRWKDTPAMNLMVSMAIDILNGEGTHLRKVNLKSAGKLTYSLRNGYYHSIIDSNISGSYFVVAPLLAELYVSRTKLQQNLSGDLHSLIYHRKTNQFYEDISIATFTGRSFASGNDGTGSVVRVKNIESIAPTSLDTWLQRHVNFKNIVIHLYGRYPRIKDFFDNPGNPGWGRCSENGCVVIKH